MAAKLQGVGHQDAKDLPAEIGDVIEFGELLGERRVACSAQVNGTRHSLYIYIYIYEPYIYIYMCTCTTYDVGKIYSELLVVTCSYFVREETGRSIKCLESTPVL